MRGSVISPGVLLAGGALVIHELRHTLAPSAHDHVAVLVPVLALLCLGRRPARGPVTRWLALSAALLAAYAGQELVEGGPAAVLHHGGLIAVALALAVGAAIGALLRDVEAAAVQRASRGLVRASGGALALWRPRAAPVFRCRVLARHLAGRAPPPLSS